MRNSVAVTAELIDAILAQGTPDMNRIDETIQDGRDGPRRDCFSESALRALFADEVVEGMCVAFEGTPMWPETVRAFAIGFYEGRLSAIRDRS